MSETYFVLKTDGKIDKIITEDYISLEKMNDVVGGYIQTTRIADDPSLLVVANEDGLLLDLPPNPFIPGVVGNVILSRKVGEDIGGLSEEQITRLRDLLGE